MNIICIRDEIERINKNMWQLSYNELFIHIGGIWWIRVVLDKEVIWYEVDSEPLMVGCYSYCSTDLRETLSWCYDNLDERFKYY